MDLKEARQGVFRAPQDERELVVVRREVDLVRTHRLPFHGDLKVWVRVRVMW